MIGIYWWMYHGESSRYFVGCHTFNFLVVFSGVWRSFFSIFFGRLNGDILSDLSQTFSLYFFQPVSQKIFFRASERWRFVWPLTDIFSVLFFNPSLKIFFRASERWHFVWPLTDIFSVLFFSPSLKIFFFRASERWILSIFCLAFHKHFLYTFFGASLNIVSGVWTVDFVDILSDLSQIFSLCFFPRVSKYFFGRLNVNFFLASNRHLLYIFFSGAFSIFCRASLLHILTVCQDQNPGNSPHTMNTVSLVQLEPYKWLLAVSSAPTFTAKVDFGLPLRRMIQLMVRKHQERILLGRQT